MKFNEIVQWIGAAMIIVGHALNAIGPAAYPYNICAFVLGTIMFLIWAIRLSNKPQLIVNIVSLSIGVIGLAKVVI